MSIVVIKGDRWQGGLETRWNSGDGMCDQRLKSKMERQRTQRNHGGQPSKSSANNITNAYLARRFQSNKTDPKTAFARLNIWKSANLCLSANQSQSNCPKPAATGTPSAISSTVAIRDKTALSVTEKEYLRLMWPAMLAVPDVLYWGSGLLS